MSELASPFMDPTAVPTERELVMQAAEARKHDARVTPCPHCDYPVVKQAVSVGDLLSFYSHVKRIGRTSITVQVEVFAERDPEHPQVVKVTEAELIFVAIDREGKPRTFQLGER